MRNTILTFLLLVSSHLIVHGQSADYGSITQFFDISSDEAKAYQLKVTLPTNYDVNKTYKALYYFDAWWLSELVLGSYAVLSITQKVDDVILIGITLDGNVLDWNKQRTFDYTPSRYDMPIAQKVGIGDEAISLDSSTTGGADQFLDFLETKAFPLIEREFPNTGTKRGFLGHSFSGLFGFYLMQKSPEMFIDFIIISPSLWWNKPEMLNPELFHDYSMQKGPGKLHLSFGEDESNWIVQSNNTMDGILNDLEKDHFDYQFTTYPEANHNSILSRAIYDGLLHLYGK